MTETHSHILVLATQIVTAHVRSNDIAINSVPNLIRGVYNTLSDIGRDLTGASVLEAPLPELAPPVHSHDHALTTPIAAQNGYVHPSFGQTVFEDRLICMEDGLSMKMLKRHLLTVHGMTPDDYRAKWDLPEAYPMVANTYAKLRSNLALQSGLGLKPDARAVKLRKAR